MRPAGIESELKEFLDEVLKTLLTKTFMWHTPRRPLSMAAEEIA